MATPPSCPFCERLIDGPLVGESALAGAFRDAFPVSEGHTLIVPRRHEAGPFSLTASEVKEMVELLAVVKGDLDRDCEPDGYNIGVNAGTAAGQTVEHVHVHLIPRYDGDTSDPRGGIRWVLPNRADYWNQ
jgi:diadenosine tetraphosphate (Ap4A) HIT family hydrolase